MKYYNLFILIKRKRKRGKKKKELIKDKVVIENTEERVRNKVRESLKL